MSSVDQSAAFKMSFTDIAAVEAAAAQKSQYANSFIG